MVSGHNARRLKSRQILSDLFNRKIHDISEVIGRHLDITESEDNLHAYRMGKESENCDGRVQMRRLLGCAFVVCLAHAITLPPTPTGYQRDGSPKYRSILAGPWVRAAG